MLRPHQTKALSECITRLESNGLAILEGQQRSGKSMVALKTAEDYCANTLFLTKKKAIPGVKDDCSKLWGEVPEWLTIMNYESVHKLPDESWGLIICDESHSSGLSSFPKPSLVWRRVSALFKRTKAKALLMSGTISIETKAQLYHEVSVTGRGPWVRYGNFFKWWNHAGHYKKPVDVGGYGIRGSVKRIGGGKEVTDYAQVDGDRIDRDISPLLVTVSRAQAGFKVTEASQKVVKCANGAILGLCDEIAKEGIVRIGDRLCVYETPAARLMGAHMACGGTLLDDQGQGFVLPDEFEPRYKLDLIRKRAKQGLKYVIFAHYIYERAFLLSELGDSSCEDVETFRTNDCQFCVLSTTSYSMGVDLSWLSGCCIMYSIPWSGAVWSQVLDRQLHFKREREAVVAVLLLEDGVDTLVYEAVSRKQNFNLSRYRCSKSISSPRS